nr:RNA polymerase beta chain, chloroplastic [Tanacetum cinerariifolium]
MAKHFIRTNIEPKWMVLRLLPVLPPELRPIYHIDEDKLVTSDINEIYRRIIYRNNTLTDLLTTSVATPEELIISQEKLLQEAVDALLDNGICGQPMRDDHNRVYKSLSDVIEGKEGRVRETLLAMTAKFEIEKFNGNNFSLGKLKMKAILRKDKCLAAIGERPAEVTNDSKWDEMDGNAIANLHLALADGVLSKRIRKVQRRFGIILLDYSPERAEILLQSLPDSYDQVIINLTINVLSDYLVFDDVA